MTYLAFRNLWQQKFRLALSIGGVALAVMLIVFLNGFQSGIFRQVTTYLDHTLADVVVAQEDVTNMLGATSLLLASAADLARGAPGIQQVIPIVSRFIILDIHDKKVVAYMVGYELKVGGGPWALKAGRTPQNDREVVVDWVMAETHHFSLGETLEILDEDFTIVGLSEGTSSWMASFIFIEKRAAERLLLIPVSSVLIRLNRWAAPRGSSPEPLLYARMRPSLMEWWAAARGWSWATKSRF